MKVTLTRSKIYVPAPVYNQQPRWVRLMNVFACFIAVMLMYLLFMVVIVEFATGCGTTLYHDNGTWETLDCAFIPYTPTKGTW